LSTALGCRN